MCGGNVRVHGGVAVHGCMTEQVREGAGKAGYRDKIEGGTQVLG